MAKTELIVDSLSQVGFGDGTVGGFVLRVNGLSMKLLRGTVGTNVGIDIGLVLVDRGFGVVISAKNENISLVLLYKVFKNPSTQKHNYHL